MPTRNRLILMSCLLLACLGPARGQEIVDSLPPAYTMAPDLWPDAAALEADARWHGNVLERFAGELSDGRYLAILDALAEDSRAAVGRQGGEPGARFQREFDLLVAQFRQAVQAAALSDSLVTPAQRAAVVDGLGDRGVMSLVPDQVLDDMGFGRDVYFSTSVNRIDLYEPLDDGRFRLLVPPDVMRALRLRGDAVRAVLATFIDPIQQEQFAAIKLANRQWENYLGQGYSQYPWEAAFNGWVLNFHAFDPPDKQWILAHPSLAVEASTLSLDQVTAKEVLSVELLGFLWYFGEANEHFCGVSVAAVLRDDLGPGVGPVLHWRRNVSVGVAWHDVDGNDRFDDDPYVFMSFDVFRFLQTEGPRFRQEYAKARALLE